MANLKRLLYIFLPVFVILLMSHNAGAVSPVYDLSGYEKVQTYNSTFDCNYLNTSLDANLTGAWTCPLHAGNSLTSITTNGTITLKKGDIVEFPLMVYSTGAFSLVNSLKFEWLNTRYGFSLIDIRLVDNNYQSVFGQDTSLIPTGYTINQIWVITLSANLDVTTNVGFGSGTFAFMTYSGETVGGYNLVFRMGNVNTWRYTGSAENEAAEKDLQGVENIENQSSDDYQMESANMSSLFSQFGGFITAVQGAHVGDCNIPANLNHMDLGILNMCANPVPDYAQVAVSIIVCMLIAPYLLNIIKRIIGIADKVREV